MQDCLVVLGLFGFGLIVMFMTSFITWMDAVMNKAETHALDETTTSIDTWEFQCVPELEVNPDVACAIGEQEARRVKTMHRYNMSGTCEEQSYNRVLDVVFKDALRRGFGSLAKWAYSKLPANYGCSSCFRLVCLSNNRQLMQWVFDTMLSSRDIIDIQSDWRHDLMWTDAADWLWELSLRDSRIVPINMHRGGDTMFKYAFINNNMTMVRWLWYLSNDTFDLDVVVRECRSMEMIEWLIEMNYEDRPIDFQGHNRFLFINVACRNGDFEMARWLLKNTAVTLRGSRFFEEAVRSGNLNFVQWVWSLGESDVNQAALTSAFETACKEGHLDIAKWMFVLMPERLQLNIERRLSYAMSNAAEYGHAHVLEWLWEIYGQKYVGPVHESGIRIHDIISWGSNSGTIDGIQWLYKMVPKIVEREVCSTLYHFTDAAEYGQLEVLKFYWKVSFDSHNHDCCCRYKIKEQFARAKLNACRLGHVNVIDWLDKWM